MTIKELLDKIKRHDCEPGIFKVLLVAGGHFSGYNASVDFRPTKLGAASSISTHGGTPEEALASLLSVLEEKWARCPHCGGYLNGESKMAEPVCPRCGGGRLRRDTQHIQSKLGSRHHATGSWFTCLNIDCTCCFDGVTDHADGLLPWWVEKRAAGRVWHIEEETE